MNHGIPPFRPILSASGTPTYKLAKFLLKFLTPSTANEFIVTFTGGFSFSLTCETNFKAVNFLDVALNLATGKYQPYNKPQNIQHSF